MSESHPEEHQSLVRLLRDSILSGLMFAAIIACASREPVPSQLISHEERFHEWQIIDTASGQAIRMDDWMRELAQQDVVYLGEEHHNRFHIEAALRVLRGLIEQGRKPTLAMEMFGWDGQSALDQYGSGQNINLPLFLEQVHWLQNWGGPFEDYEPLVQFAKERRLSLVAMNPPKSLIKAVMKKGLVVAQTDPEMVQWGMQNESIVDDPLYRGRIMRQLQLCHGGGEDNLYQSMYEASMVRDEGMAKTIVDRLAALRLTGNPSIGPLVSYTGGGHIQYYVPVPKRVIRRAGSHVHQLSIYMTAFEKDRASDLGEMIRDKIADYVWLTPIGSQGPPRRCR